MAVIREIVFLLSLLFHVANTDVSEPIFRAKGKAIEMGYCFGVDYIAVFRSAPGGDQLLGNSSEDAATTLLPNDLQGRVTITNHQQLLGLQISQLQHSDSGVYRRECWQNEELVNQYEHELSVCDEEVDSREIAVMEDGGAELLCNSSSIGLKGAIIRWYHEVPPLYRATLFLDSNVSLVPLLKELQGVVEVQRSGTALRVPQSVLEEIHHFYCLVIHGQSCLSFQNIYLPDSEDIHSIIASEGDRVVLVCPSEHKSLVPRWDTPLGMINSTTMAVTATEENANVNQMYLLGSGQSGNFSLVIPVVSEKYSGDYSCFAPSLVAEFSLIVCPKMTSRKKEFSVGEDVVLECEMDESQTVKWYRPRAQGEDSLILDSTDINIPIPKDLSGRVNLAEHGGSLHLSSVMGEDAGEYWCAVVTSPEYDTDVDDIPDDDEYSTEDDDYVYDSQLSPWTGMEQCISKQVTYLTLADTTPHKPAPSSMTTYAMAAVGTGLALVILTVVIVFMKKRATRLKKQKEEGTGSPVEPSQQGRREDARVSYRRAPVGECNA